jgi:hypothetical protein
VDDAHPNLRIALGVVGALIIVILAALIIVLFSAGGGQTAAITDTTAVPTTTTTTAATTTTTTTAATTTTTAAPSTTTTSTTVASTSTTTAGPLDPSEFDTTTKAAEVYGDPGVGLTDVRVGDHATFARIVFDFAGDGTPGYVVGYEEGPGFTGFRRGERVSPAGSFFLVVRVTPGLTYNPDDLTPIYLGPLSFDPGLDPIAEIAFVDDFDEDMVWVIGLQAESGFQVTTRLEPPRLVIDIAK